MPADRVKIGGKDYSVFNPTKVRLGLRLWTEAFIRAIPRQAPERRGSAPTTTPEP